MNTSEIQKNKARYGIIGNCEELNRAIDMALQVAPTDLSVLITGENGSGKEVIPRLIHDNSARRHKKFMAVNCGSIPEGTIDSELFGHKKGSFTGALQDREGYFGSADGGTLFLDEVGELPMATQARLLRVLETGEYIRMGEDVVRKTNVRIVAATNVNFQKAISERRFREDLFYRLNQIPIFIPPLRKRGDDIIKLFMKFAMDVAEKYNMPPVQLAEDAKPLLLAYKWPGNVRPLRNLVEQISVVSEERRITLEVLKRYVPEDAETTEVLDINHNKKEEHSFSEERDMIYGFIYELRKQVADLRNRVAELEGGQSHKSDSVAKVPAGLPAPKHLTTDIPVVTPSSSDYGSSDWIDVEDVEPSEGAHSAVEQAEKKMIEDALRKHHNRRKIVADALGMSERTLYRKIKKYGLE